MEKVDLSTHISTLYQHHDSHYNHYKFFYNRKKRCREEIREEPDFEIPSSSLSCESKVPKFRLLNFVQDWKKQKEMDDMEPIIVSGGDKKKRMHFIDLEFLNFIKNSQKITNNTCISQA